MPLSLILLALGVLLLGVAGWLLKWKPTIDAPFFWRKWSTWLAGFNASLWAYATAHSGMLLGFLPFVPPHYQGFAAGAAFVVAFIVPVVAANIRQQTVRDLATERAVNKAMEGAK